MTTSKPAVWFIVTKRFTSGLLNGLTVDEMTPVQFEVGFVCKPWWGCPSGYTVEACVPVIV